jgi:dTDP-3-amino-2,3,6-trideoxy-4-keto-D-glucose/dTDP-3-amino-3,4,6-trideoxy-alpha-D-glucose/dTDP-2,6-dideoxy-D-kanosamine transaminase
MQVKYSYLPEQFAEVEPYFEELRELVASGEFTLGPWVERFERKFAKYVGVKHVVSTNTGTDALILALKAVGVRPGDEVITVANTFYATAGAIVAAGARPVFVDCDARMNIDVTKIEAAVTSKTRAIVPVHWAGCPCDVEAVVAIARKRRLEVVEDACPTVGGKVGGRSVGSFGKVNAFSMHPLKPLNVWGDGGMCATDDDDAAAWMRLYRNHGMIDRDHLAIWGVNMRLQPVQAIVGSRQLDEIESLCEARIRNARRLDEGLKGLSPHVRVQPRPSNVREVYQLYLILCERRDELIRFLNGKGIEARCHYPVPLHLQKPARELGYKEGDFPVAEKQAREVVTLPAHQHVSDAQVDFMIATIREFYAGGPGR